MPSREQRRIALAEAIASSYIASVKEARKARRPALSQAVASRLCGYYDRRIHEFEHHVTPYVLDWVVRMVCYLSLYGGEFVLRVEPRPRPRDLCINDRGRRLRGVNPPPCLLDLSSYLRGRRERLGLTLRQVRRELGYHISMISYDERRPPSDPVRWIEVGQDMARVLETDFSLTFRGV
ncbi:MAG: helix-turn-helix domain-containing protein [Mycobacterium sp.]